MEEVQEKAKLSQCLMTSEHHAMKAVDGQRRSPAALSPPNKHHPFTDETECLWNGCWSRGPDRLLICDLTVPATREKGMVRLEMRTHVRRIRSVIGRYKFSAYLSDGFRVNSVVLC